ncbi:MAG TPA: hypothetical protein VKB79_28460 [Bryobacteraceae bacterium]|nr:hypothetical protein [Bryobacteraceae bacterium]
MATVARGLLILFVLWGFGACSAGAQGRTVSGTLHNERLKLLSLPDRPIDNHKLVVVLSGVLVPESSLADKALVFPQQVRITCDNSPIKEDRSCTEIVISWQPSKEAVSVDIGTEEYAVERWDDQGLIASYGGDITSDNCQRHVLSVDFASGVASVSDIPTHRKNCEAFTTTNSYRLVHGFYYVDTTPANNLDRASTVKSK